MSTPDIDAPDVPEDAKHFQKSDWMRAQGPDWENPLEGMAFCQAPSHRDSRHLILQVESEEEARDLAQWIGRVIKCPLARPT